MVSWGRSPGIFIPRPAVQGQGPSSPRQDSTREVTLTPVDIPQKAKPCSNHHHFKWSVGNPEKTPDSSNECLTSFPIPVATICILTYNPKSSPPSRAHAPKISLGGFPKHQRETHGSECLWYHACVCMYLYTYASVYFVDTHIDSNRLHR